jgi:hypothetical protein
VPAARRGREGDHADAGGKLRVAAGERAAQRAWFAHGQVLRRERDVHVRGHAQRVHSCIGAPCADLARTTSKQEQGQCA